VRCIDYICCCFFFKFWVIFGAHLLPFHVFGSSSFATAFALKTPRLEQTVDRKIQVAEIRGKTVRKDTQRKMKRHKARRRCKRQAKCTYVFAFRSLYGPRFVFVAATGISGRYLRGMWVSAT
jgi:hypothetical protein